MNAYTLNKIPQNLFLPLFLVFSLVQKGIGQVPPSKTTYPEGVTSIEVPFTRYRNWIIVKMKVNEGKTLSFILDTGAPIGVLGDKNAGENLGLTIAGQALVAGGEGQPPKPVPLATGVKLTLGHLQIDNCMVAIGAASDAISGVDGVIGTYIFENSVVAINWDKNRLVLTNPEYFHYDGNGMILPFKMSAAGHIYTGVTVEYNGTTKAIPATIDTGNRSHFKMTQSEEGMLYGKEDALKGIIVGWGANGPEYGDLTRINLVLGNIRIPGVIASSSPNTPGQPEKDGITGNIGLSLLERFNLIFDYPNSRVILEKNAAFDNPFEYTRSGIILHPKREATYVEIADVIAGSSAFEKGLKKGDRIVGINGRSVTTYTTDATDNLLSGRDMGEVTLEVNRKEQRFRVLLIMKKLI